MILYAYSDDGMAMRAVDPDYVAQAGEIVFSDTPSPADLGKAFPAHAARKAAQDSELMRADISRACTDQIATVLAGKSDSMMREALFLQNNAWRGTKLTDEQVAEVAMFNAINDWETRMIETRESLISKGVNDPALIAETWPTPPDGLAKFLTGF